MMSNIQFLALNTSDKKDIFMAVSEQSGITAFAVEKDWWVSRTLDIIFQLDIAKHIVFKGGTSLSKAWGLIDRFSEDIDLAIDQEFFMSPTNNWSKKERTHLRKIAGKYSTDHFFLDIEKSFINQGYEGLKFQVIETTESDKDPRILKIFYPALIAQNGNYMEPCVQVELSCRSLREPFSERKIESLVDTHFSGKDFAMESFMVPTVNPERTFLEKLFLLHEEFHRPVEKRRVDRLSRHLYDVYQLAQVGINELAFRDKSLYQTIVAHRHVFSKIAGVDYNMHHPNTLNPIPPKAIIASWEQDYDRMVESMIYEKNPPTFAQLIETLEQLRAQLQQVSWDFDLKI
jgi:predicted nucleotidyltransferase component of viral defense system